MRFWLRGRHRLRHHLRLGLRLELGLGCRLEERRGRLGARLQGWLPRRYGGLTNVSLLIGQLGRLLGGLWGLGGAIDGHFDVLGQVAHGVIVVLAVAVDRRRARGPGLCLLLCFLGRDLFRREETPAWATGPAHSMFVSGLVQVGLGRGMGVGGLSRTQKSDGGRTFLCFESLWTSSRRARATRRLRMR